MAKTTTPQIKIVNCETGEEIVRDASAQEIAQMEINKEADITRKAFEAEKVAAKQTILDRIGLTADELKTILG
jgi:uncharacterized protein (UPF0371 family)